MGTIERCRCCGTDAKEFLAVFDLSGKPLANNLKMNRQAAEDAPRFPLRLVRCPTCALVLIDYVVDPNVLFGEYAYRSSMSQTYKDHCYKMAVTIKQRFDKLVANGRRPFVIDIAGNDGALLIEFKKVFDAALMNVDPAHNLCNLAMDAGIPSACMFWGAESAKRIVGSEDPGGRKHVFDKAQIITATNVFAHVDNVRDFLAGVDFALADDGVFIVEFPHVVDFLARGEFDTIYHEHLSYMGLTAFVHALRGLNLVVFDCEKFPIHGGTLRLYVGRPNVYGVSARVLGLRIEEEILRRDDIYDTFARRSHARIERMRKRIMRLSEVGSVAVFAASAKGNTFLNSLGGAENFFTCIVDETPEKIGRYSPGCGLPIVSLDAFLRSPTDSVINFAWNFHSEIETKLRAKGYKGNIYSAEE